MVKGRINQGIAFMVRSILGKNLNKLKNRLRTFSKKGIKF